MFMHIINIATDKIYLFNYVHIQTLNIKLLYTVAHFDVIHILMLLI